MAKQAKKGAKKGAGKAGILKPRKLTVRDASAVRGGARKSGEGQKDFL